MSQNVVDTFFEYDKCDIQADQQGSLHAGRSFCSSTLTSASRSRDTATNVARSNTTWALGTSRADAVKNALTQAGISGASRRSGTARKRRSAPTTPRNAGCRTGVGVSSTGSNVVRDRNNRIHERLRRCGFLHADISARASERREKAAHSIHPQTGENPCRACLD